MAKKSHKRKALSVSSNSRPQKAVRVERKNVPKQIRSRGRTLVSRPASTFKETSNIHNKHGQPSQLAPTIPFRSKDDILLVGEGDFSFAHSLKENYPLRFRSMTATCFDTRAQLLNKHPNIQSTLQSLDSQSTKSNPNDDASPSSHTLTSKASDSTNQENEVDAPRQRKATQTRCKILYSIDATKLSTYRTLSKPPHKYDRIVFNFPHVGGSASGKSKDVNRQVRYNQELVHSFFNACRGLLRRPGEVSISGVDRRKGQNKNGNGDRRDTWDQDDESDVEQSDLERFEVGEEIVRRGGTVLVTLFEGHPYTLWNIRDLARSAGFKVIRSWRFDWKVYPGYSHARTLGDLKDKKKRGPVEEAVQADVGRERKGHGEGDEDDEWSGLTNDENGGIAEIAQDEDGVSGGRKRKSRWKGEDRAARTYEFGFPEAESQKTRKRAENGSSDSDSM